MGHLRNILNRVRRQKEKETGVSLKNEPFVLFDLAATFYIRYRCKTCDLFVDAPEGDDSPYTECQCGSTDLFATYGKKWALTHEKEFREKFKTTSDIRVPVKARDWLVGQEKPMRRELMEVKRWIYKKKLQQNALRNAKVVKRVDLEATLGRPVSDNTVIELEKKSYRVHFLTAKEAILEPGNFMKENPGPYILRISEPGTGKTMASKIINEEAEEMYKAAGIEATDVLTIENPMDSQRPLVRQVPCHSIQGKGCLAPRIAKQAERTAIAEQKQKQQLIYTFLTIAMGFGAALLMTGLFIMTLYVMSVGVFAAWFQYMSAYIGFIVTGVPLLVFPLFILVLGNNFLMRTDRQDLLNTPYPIVTHNDRPKYLIDATVSDSATLMGSIQWNAYGNTPGLTGPLHKRVISGIVHRGHDFIVNVDELKNMGVQTAIEMLSVMEDGESYIRNRGGGVGAGSEAPGIVAISTADPVPADFMLICNGNMDMLYDPHSVLQLVKAFFDRFNYGDGIYYETHIDATFENQLKIAQVITDEISRFMLFPMQADGVWRIVEYMRSRSDNNQRYKIMFRYVIKVVLKSFEIALMEDRKNVTAEDVETAIRDYCDTIPEQAEKEHLRNAEPFTIYPEGQAYGAIKGLAVTGGSGGKAFPVVAESFPVEDHHYGDFVVTGTVKQEDSWVQDSIKVVRTVIRKLYDIDIMKQRYTHVSFAQQKDVEGPSAGCAMTLAIMSQIGDPRVPAEHEGECPTGADGKSLHLDAKSKKPRHREPVPLRQDVAVTGTVELIPHPTDRRNVRVGAIGGVSYKVQGAANAKCNYVVIPQENFEHTLTNEKYPCTIFGADSILGYFDLLRADQKNIEALLEVRKPTSPEAIKVHLTESARRKVTA